MLVLTTTVYWKWFVNYHHALGLHNQVIPNNAKTKKRDYVILMPTIHSCDWCSSIYNQHKS